MKKTGSLCPTDTCRTTKELKARLVLAKFLVAAYSTLQFQDAEGVVKIRDPDAAALPTAPYGIPEAFHIP